MGTKFLFEETALENWKHIEDNMKMDPKDTVYYIQACTGFKRLAGRTVANVAFWLAVGAQTAVSGGKKKKRFTM
jgi:hypothetical protein